MGKTVCFANGDAAGERCKLETGHKLKKRSNDFSTQTAVINEFFTSNSTTEKVIHKTTIQINKKFCKNQELEPKLQNQ